MQNYMTCIGNCTAWSILESNNLSTNQGVPLLLQNKYPLSWSQKLPTGSYRENIQIRIRTHNLRLSLMLS